MVIPTNWPGKYLPACWVINLAPPTEIAFNTVFSLNFSPPNVFSRHLHCKLHWKTIKFSSVRIIIHERTTPGHTRAEEEDILLSFLELLLYCNDFIQILEEYLHHLRIKVVASFFPHDVIGLLIGQSRFVRPFCC